MERITSRNPNRTEENKDLFDWMEGYFVVSWVGVSGNGWTETFSYTGNNMHDSVEDRFRAWLYARRFQREITPFSIEEVTIEEIAIKEGEYYEVQSDGNGV